MESIVVVDPVTGRQKVVRDFDSQVKQFRKKIREACDEFRLVPDWAKNMEIIDFLNGHPYMCPYAIQEIRVQLKTKNPEIEVLALTLAEGIVKNCPASHGSVAAADFMRYLVKVALNQRKDGSWKAVGKKLTFSKKASTTSIDGHRLRAQTIDKALLLIRMLGDAYADGRRYPIFHKTMRELEAQGVKFPKPTKDEALQLFTPTASKSPPASAPVVASTRGSAVSDAYLSAVGSGAIRREESIPTVAAKSIRDRHLPMIRPVFADASIHHPKLKSALDNTSFLFEMINNSTVGTDLYTDDLISMLVATVKSDQVSVQTLASDPSCHETDLLNALQVNELIIQVLQDRDALAMGHKRRFVEEINVAQLTAEADREMAQSMEDPSDAAPSVFDASVAASDSALITIAPPPSDLEPARPRPASPRRHAAAKARTDSHGDMLQLGPTLASAMPKTTSASASGSAEIASSDDLLAFMGSAVMSTAATVQSAPAAAFAPTAYAPVVAVPASASAPGLAPVGVSAGVSSMDPTMATMPMAMDPSMAMPMPMPSAAAVAVEFTDYGTVDSGPVLAAATGPALGGFPMAVPKPFVPKPYVAPTTTVVPIPSAFDVVSEDAKVDAAPLPFQIEAGPVAAVTEAIGGKVAPTETDTSGDLFAAMDKSGGDPFAGMGMDDPFAAMGFEMSTDAPSVKPKRVEQSSAKPKKADDIFGGNPFGQSLEKVAEKEKNGDNPFDSLDDPFAAATDDPFAAMFSTTGAGEDPFNGFME